MDAPTYTPHTLARVSLMVLAFGQLVVTGAIVWIVARVLDLAIVSDAVAKIIAGTTIVLGLFNAFLWGLIQVFIGGRIKETLKHAESVSLPTDELGDDEPPFLDDELELLSTKVHRLATVVHANVQARADDGLKTQAALAKIEDLGRRLAMTEEEVKKANKLKTAFLANMSHELRTPMHGILSFANFGIKKIDQVAKDKLQFYFLRIHESARRLMKLLDDLLDMSKLEAGKMLYQMRVQDFKNIVDEMFSEFDAFASLRRIAFHLENPNTPAYAYYDASRISQVLSNLISNAIKYSYEGETIVVETSADYNGGTELVVRIKNRGTPIPKDELEVIFETFTQSSNTDQGVGGTGMGLAICRQIVRDHGGRIWAESDADGNTSFSFTLPVREAAREAA